MKFKKNGLNHGMKFIKKQCLNIIFYIIIYYKNMGGGLLQLVAKGAQDVYLINNPQITNLKTFIIDIQFFNETFQIKFPW